MEMEDGGVVHFAKARQGIAMLTRARPHAALARIRELRQHFALRHSHHESYDDTTRWYA